jgi:two-component system, chemotaxis family, protein-glutamate methylesterase/glutaminase
VARYDVAVVGASAGGVEALTKLVRALPPDLPIPVLIVLHISGESLLPNILQRVARVPVKHAEDGERARPGRVYVAPPDRHIALRDGTIVLSRGPRENGHRPAIDPLFRSAARQFRERAIGVVLSGQLDDGSAGLLAIHTRGGLTMVQDPDDANYPSMPRNALRYVDADQVLPADRLGAALVRLIKGDPMAARKRKMEKGETRTKTRPSQRALSAARISARAEQETLVCPDCSGPLHREVAGKLTQWKCAVGHTFSPDSLTEAQTDSLERVLWIAVRTLSERAQVQRQTIARMEEPMRQRMQERAESTEQDVALIRSILDRL